MEKTIITNKIPDRSEGLEKYDRIYFGNEFCERLLPSENELKEIIKLSIDINKPLTLVTPFLTNQGLGKAKNLLKIFYGFDFVLGEVVVNDLGLLYEMKKEGYNNLVLGRLLTKQKRGPRIVNLQNKLTSTALHHFKKFNADQDRVIDFLEYFNIIRFDLDNTLQGITATSNIPKSIYLPFVYVSTTRYCLASKLNKKEFKLRKIGDCNKECLNMTFVLKNKNMPKKIYLKGNTQFYKNDRLPDKLEDLNINRIVLNTSIFK